MWRFEVRDGRLRAPATASHATRLTILESA